MTVFELIKSDYLKYKKYASGFFGIVFLTQGFWAILDKTDKAQHTMILRVPALLISNKGSKEYI